MYKQESSKSKSGINHASPSRKDEREEMMRTCNSNIIDEGNCSSPREDLDVESDNQDLSQTLSHFIKLNPVNKAPENGPIFFFDLDNTLYRKSSGIAELMAQRIELFFQTYLHLPEAESRVLGAKFYRDYGLAIKGLIKHFAIDPAEYDKYVDGGLPLDSILEPSDTLTSLLDRLSKQGTCWIFTNAGKSHATRVLKLLGIDCFFSGIIYCDYSEPDFPAKPDRLAFTRAMKCARVSDPARCFFFDDSIGNIRTAQEIGWNVVYIDEDTDTNKMESSIDEINASMEIISKSEGNEKTFMSIRYIEEVERILKIN